MSHEWKFGDWGKSLSGVIVRFVSNWTDQTIFVTSNGSINSLCDVEHIPECTGFDWKPPKPIEPPEGYRLMDKSEPRKDGDIWYDEASLTWKYSDVCSSLQQPKLIYARKIEPQHRPFANAAEYEPHREKWLVDEDGECVRVIRIRPDAKIGTCHGSISFTDAFVRYKFEDGTPFGVPVNVEA